MKGIFLAGGSGTRLYPSSIAEGSYADVFDIPVADHSSKVRRPTNSRLSGDKFEATFGWQLPDWHLSAETAARRLVPESCKV